jgi:2,4-dienoyl-CoA reductase (NADPH2)
LHQVEALESLHQLLTQGQYHIKIMELGSALAPDMGKSSRWVTLKHLKLMGVESFLNSKVEAITQDGVKAIKNAEEIILAADTVILAAGSTSANSLYHKLQDLVADIYLVGDAAAPGKVINAIHDAFALASSI